ncbi:hypothetical protein [Ralstonia mannitolilytica]|uniref:hypothetical protein n=1 Tax=Ralstonia mannitolilytica TaxID=105219 RepID=UPI00292F6016|nr:hypothetical protein [Ralstonia mannitolilytica]
MSTRFHAAAIAACAVFIMACGDHPPSGHEPHSAPALADSASLTSDKFDPDFIGHSIDSLLVDVPSPLARESKPLPDGTPREILTITKWLTLEAVGDLDLLQRYSLVFTFSPQEQETSMLTGLQLARILSNTFPGWRDGDGGVNPVRWLRTATAELRENIQKDGERAKPVEMTRDGLRVRYRIVPGEGKYVIEVTPMRAT